MSANDPIADVRHRCNRALMNEPSFAPLDNYINPMLGLVAWGVQQGHGSFLTFEFGEPELRIEERYSQDRGRWRYASVSGNWHLWIYCCHWRVLQDGVQLAHSEDSSEHIARATSRLNGQKIVGVEVDPSRGRSTFTFDLGGALETRPYEDDATDVQWHIMADSQIFSFRADGRYCFGPSNARPEEERWSAF
ncbi:hypothetical protein [Sphingomicrobium arenosum]|uniref:hypothetical protein n=1 Tax=Sphingomicrobium arenosum TaxID=2233861 RepID=UPI00223EB6F4|nr:hypothetical protein [Sphingomicrobium arenosum]